MNLRYRRLIIIALLLFSGVSYTQAQDFGARDTMQVMSRTIPVGQSVPISVRFFNDQLVTAVTGMFELTSLDSGKVIFDSVLFDERLSDPNVLGYRGPAFISSDTVSPDTVGFWCMQLFDPGLPAGSGTIARMYFTGLAPGRVKFDSTSSIGGATGVRVVEDAASNNEYAPEFVAGIMEVREVYPPDLAMSVPSPRRVESGTQVTFELIASSPVGYPVRLTLAQFADVDDLGRVPSSAPEFVSTGPTTFTWTPASSDVGIWRAVFVATDSSGQTKDLVAEIQVVGSAVSLVELNAHEVERLAHATKIMHGNYDGDALPELVMTCVGFDQSKVFSLLESDGFGQLAELFALYTGNPTRGMDQGLLNTDAHLDVIFQELPGLRVLYGDGFGGFTDVPNQPDDVTRTRTGVLSNVNGDAVLDYVAAGRDFITYYQGQTDGRFVDAGDFSLHDSALSIVSSDFDLDGFDDLAIGTKTGLRIYLNDRAGGYSEGPIYTQSFGSFEIDMTTPGSDFNGDQLIDLCVASPPPGGESGDLIVYLGQGDGSFLPRTVRSVAGLIYALNVGDVNGDTRLDIVYLNSTENHVGILFGDGDGWFSDEVRYPLPRYSPRQLVCLDDDLDGDLDIVVASYIGNFNDQSVLYRLENQLDPMMAVRANLEIEIENNAELELTSPSGGRLSRIASSLSAGSLYRCNLDSNTTFDGLANVNVLEPGRYDLFVTPRSDQAAGAAFSLAYTANGERLKIVTDLPMAAQGYRFPIYPVGSSPVFPRQGECVQISLPTFHWEANGVERFELATDIGFGNILESATVSGGVYTLPMVLPEADSTPYYWRVRPETGEDTRELSTFYLMRSPTDVEDDETNPLLPDSCWLAQNYPNPFNPTTTVEYHLAESGPVKISIHNVLGQLIKTLVDRPMPTGTFTVDWDATDLYERPVASGIYFYRMEMGEFAATRKMVLVR